MKRTRYISLIIALLSVLGLAAQQQQSQYALYNYRNDGDFNAWLNIDVDSITYSNIGLDSVEYDNIVTQEVWTPDSCYRIPIEAIDSIGFRAPETQYKEGVFFLNEEHEPYVRSIDDLKITFDSATPAHLLPSVGQVICTETSYGIFEDGFAGRATSVSNTDDGLEFTCEEVSLSDIFDQFIYVSKCSSTEGGDPQQYSAKSSRKRIFDYAIGIDEVIPIDLKEVETPKKIDGEDMPIQFKYKPEMEITCLISILKGQPAVAKVTFHHSHTMSLGMDYKGDLIKPKSKEWWFSKDDIRIHIPVAAVDAVIKPYVNFGAFVDYNAKVKFEYELPILKFEQTFVVDYSEYRKEEDRLQFYNDTEFIHDDPTISLSLDGALAFGLAMKIGAKLIHKRLLNFEATFHVGPEFKGHIDLSTDRIGEDANLYRQLKSATLDLYGYVAIPRASYQYFNSGVKLAKRGTWKGAKWVTEAKTEDLLPNEDNPEGIMIDWPIRKWYILPEFYKPEIYEANATSAVASVEPHRNLLFPVGVGIAFKDYVTGEVVEKDCDSYWGTKFNAEDNYTTTFEDLTPSSVYKVYPTVSLLGIKMDAEPSVDYGVAGKLIVTPSSITIKKGEEAEVTIFGAMGNLQAVDDDPNIAKSLSIIYDHRTGQHITLHVLGVSVGSTYITVRNRNNGSSCIVRVYVVDTDKPVTGITLSETTLNMNPCDTKALTATVMPEDAENKTVKWTSSNGAVAMVSTGGIVTAIGEGTCTITCSATDGSGVKAECQVTVTEQAATQTGETLNVVRETGLGYSPTYAHVDFTAAKTYLGVNEVTTDMLFIINPDNSEVGAYKGWFPSDGWFNGDGVLTGWGTESMICVKFFNAIPDGQFEILDMDGADEVGKTYTTRWALKANGKTYTYTINVTFIEATPHEYVDLGLPSGTLWATCNVGANSPEEYGDYFAWGETEPKATYNWDTYFDSDYNKYNNEGGLTELAAADDAATANWGSGWQMPSVAQQDELRENCTREWTQLNGVNGILVTGPNGDSIFLPAAGYRYDTNLNYAGSYGFYWSRSLGASSSDGAYSLYFNSGTWGWLYFRNIGRSVRPVRVN